MCVCCRGEVQASGLRVRDLLGIGLCWKSPEGAVETACGLESLTRVGRCLEGAQQGHPSVSAAPSPLRLTRASTLCTCRKGLKQRPGSHVSLSPFALSKEQPQRKRLLRLPGHAPLRAVHFPRHLRQMPETAQGASSRLPLGCSRAPSCHLHHFHHGIAPGYSYPPPPRDLPPFNTGVPPIRS